MIFYKYFQKIFINKWKNKLKININLLVKELSQFENQVIKYLEWTQNENN